MKLRQEAKLIILMLLCSSILLIPHVVRKISNPNPIGLDTYYHLRSIESFKQHGIQREDNLIFGSRPYKINIIDLVMSLMPNTSFLVEFLPFFLGTLSVFLLYLILREVEIESNTVFSIIVVLIASPIFIYSFTVFSEIPFLVFLLFLATYLLLKNRYIVSTLILCVLLILNIQIIPFIALLLALYYKFERGKTNWRLLVAAVIMVALVVSTRLNSVSELFSDLSLKRFIADFGSELGFGIFGLCLSSIGLLYSWKNKKEYYIIYLTLLIFTPIVLVIHEFIIFLELLLAYFAGIALAKIYNRKWGVSILKTYSILLIVCGLMFSSISFIDREINFPPYKEEILSLNWLKSNSTKDDVVLSHYKYGYLIQSVSERSVVADKIYFLTSKQKTRINDVNLIFNSRHLEDAQNLLNKYNISYIWINGAMKQGEVWRRDDEGILFLLSNSEKFKRVYEYHGVEIWSYEK
ncbi:hypothetical protein JW930_06345 [Candidatus Woesearchaeota archaeon]|nr:hypothetical protein [Candidatus Woesearchaeota archaeon]